MKKVICIIIIILFIFISLVNADIIPYNSHIVKRNVMLANLYEFPEIILIGVISGPSI